ncbi:MAG: DNA polymerase III subunit delta' [Candidatus Omnitrophota bacterium]|nr:DNA polymerase III subunit delta' [Candidatus Omnitrophota bacterium]
MSFQHIRGQDKPVSQLKNYLEQASLEGGFLFSGPEGIGKKLAAVELAKALNCAENQFDACGHCPSCMKIANGWHPDVHLVSSDGGEIKIEAVRQLKSQICLKAYEGRHKVFIIDNAHRLTPEAANALLKILEEPPKNSLLILISDKPALLFKTVVSRCKAVKFFALKRDCLEQLLRQDYSLDSASAHFLAYFCEGRIGLALKLKDTGFSGQKNEVIERLTRQEKPNLDNFPLPDREEARFYLNILASWFRDIYLAKIGVSPAEIIHVDRKEELFRLAGKFHFADLDRSLNSIADSVLYLEQNINMKLLLYELGAQLWKA